RGPMAGSGFYAHPGKRQVRARGRRRVHSARWGRGADTMGSDSSAGKVGVRPSRCLVIAARRKGWRGDGVWVYRGRPMPVGRKIVIWKAFIDTLSGISLLLV